jgi:hypothetical protein
MKTKPTCPDCSDTGVISSNGRNMVCYCGATGEKSVAKKKPAPVDSQAPRYFRGAKIRNT